MLMALGLAYDANPIPVGGINKSFCLKSSWGELGKRMGKYVFGSRVSLPCPMWCLSCGCPIHWDQPCRYMRGTWAFCGMTKPVVFSLSQTGSLLYPASVRGTASRYPSHHRGSAQQHPFGHLPGPRGCAPDQRRGHGDGRWHHHGHVSR